ncbi:hypothetical protein [Quadrisphaera sp. DSM 44207]|uniref:hypothetical protein n=1 Tax=Quadrisphaera sp. DSM 44207 TaxID=1881057 RepID=UPI00088C9C8B|nr:hypothetical protein [Quadrisphaera sp. DSM 44207]SDQ67935.1 hypothetical protein SAMN05428996_2356 [Quadrisphaera sp. DSM 44207]
MALAGLVLAGLAVAGVLALRGGGAPDPGDPGGTASDRVRHIAPSATGAGDGSSWDDAGSLEDLPRFVAEVADGGEVLLRADAGPYDVGGALVLDSGGTAQEPVVVRGADADGRAAAAVLRGDRASPYSPDGESGPDVFVLRSGASGLSFEDVDFQDVGNAFLAAGDVGDLLVTRSTATNVRRFFENARADEEDSADVTGLVLRDVTVEGFSKRVLRLRYASSDVLLEDVVGDSRAQDGDDFAIGVHLEGEVHDVVLRRVTMRNTVDTLHEYWNGDGFATEDDVSDVRFEDTTASGNTDAGYDLKSSRTTLVGAVASDNKRNFRFWGQDVTAQDCEGRDPHKRGGSGSQVQVWLGEGAQVRVQDCTLTDDDPDTVVVDTETDAELVVEGGSVEHAGELQRVSDGASVDLRDVSVAEG